MIPGGVRKHRGQSTRRKQPESTENWGLSVFIKPTTVDSYNFRKEALSWLSGGECYASENW